MNPLAQMMMQMSPQAQSSPDYVGYPAPDAQGADAVMRAQQAIKQMPVDQRPSTDQEIFDFIEEMRSIRDELPPGLQLKLDRVLQSMEKQAP